MQAIKTTKQKKGTKEGTPDSTHHHDHCDNRYSPDADYRNKHHDADADTAAVDIKSGCVHHVVIVIIVRTSTSTTPVQ